MYGFIWRALLSSILGLSLVASACGSSGGGSPSGAASKGTITVGGFNFAESSILAQLYGGALKGDGYNVKYRTNLGAREIVAPALERGDIDMYPGYSATDLEYFDKGKGLATPDPQQNVQKLNGIVASMGLKALTPAPAQDEDAFAVTKATADQYHLTKLSDLAPVAAQMTLGGPPECPTRPYCLQGLQKVYGLHFKDFKPLDAGGPLTISALQNGDIQVGEVFSSDGTVASKGFVILEDDKHLQNADNVVPIVRTKTVGADAQQVLDQVSAKLTTKDLQGMNKQASVDKEDPDQIAAGWLGSHGFKT
jgi:osmoprotectant transport system substrate-binding protein